jgi:hypothetical protein
MRQYLQGWLLVAATLTTAYASAAQPTNVLPVPTDRVDIFRCDDQACAMPSTGSYPHLIVGVFKSSATAAQSRQLFADMRAHHFWQSLPDDAAAFHAALQPVAIQLPDAGSLVALMAQDEVRVARPMPGDLVRYSPHRGKYELPPENPAELAWWAIDGCVAVLCRAQDKACFKRYATGVFRTADGMEISSRTFRPLSNGAVIDPDTLLRRPRGMSR